MPYIQLPDGSFYQVADGQDPYSAYQLAQQKYPDAFKPPAPPVTGVQGDFMNALSNTGSEIAAGAKSIFGGNANQAAIDAQAAEVANAKKYQTSDSLDKIKQAYEQGHGIGAPLSALGAAIKEVPHVAASMAPGLAEIGAPGLIGGVVGGPLGATAGAALGAGLNYLQNIGSGVKEQAAEQQARGEDVNVDVGRAAGYAIPETALNYLHLAPLGKTVVGKLLGPQVDALLNKGLDTEAEEAAQKVLADKGFWKTLGTGVAQGAAIGAPSMVAQTALARAQAGQDLFSPDAFHAYGSAFTNGLLAAPIGAIGSFSERGGAQDAVAGRAAEAAAKLQESEEAHKQTPEYAADTASQYQDLVAQREEYQQPGVIPDAPKKGDPDYEVKSTLRDAIVDQRNAVGKQIKALTPEYVRTQQLHNPDFVPETTPTEAATPEAATPEAQTASVDPAVQKYNDLNAQRAALHLQLAKPLDPSAETYTADLADKRQTAQSIGKLSTEIRELEPAYQKALDDAKKSPIAVPPELTEPAVPTLTPEEVKAKHADLSTQLDTAKATLPPTSDPVARKAAWANVRDIKSQLDTVQPDYDKAVAQEQANAPSVADRAAAIVSDPALARRYLNEYPQASDYTPEQNEALRSLVKLQLTAYDKKNNVSGNPVKEVSGKPLSETKQKDFFGKALGAISSGNDLRGRRSPAAKKAAIQGDFQGVADALSKSKNATIAEVGRLAKNLKTKIRIDDTAAETRDVPSLFTDKFTTDSARMHMGMLAKLRTLAPEVSQLPEGSKLPLEMRLSKVPAFKDGVEYSSFNIDNTIENNHSMWQPLGVPEFANRRPFQETTKEDFEKLHAAYEAITKEHGKDALLRTANATTTAAPIAGQYSTKEDTVRVPELFANREHVLAHEIVHAQTVHAMADPTPAQRPIVERIENLYTHVKKVLSAEGSNAYGITTPEEFVAEGLSNPEFQYTLSRIPYQNTSVWGKFTESIAKLLGLTHNNAFTELLTAYSDIAQSKVSRSTKIDKTFPLRAKYSPELSNAGALVDKVVASQKPLTERFKKDNLNGGDPHFFDKLMNTAYARIVDSFEPALKAVRDKIDPLAATQMRYYLRMFNNRNNLINDAIVNGAPSLADSRTSTASARERLYETQKNGASLLSTNKILTDANALTGSHEATQGLFSLYNIIKRAENVGLNKLNYEGLTQEEVNKASAEIRAVPGLEAVFKRASDEWQKANKGNVDFTVQTGFLPKDVAQKMLANKDYIPYYREDANGNVSMLMGGAEIARIGSVADQPYLHELVGDNKRIVDFNTAALQNMQMLLGAATRNQAVKDTAFAMRDAGVATLSKGALHGKDNVFNFKMGGEDWRAVVHDTIPGVPAKLVVDGLKGIPTQMNTLMQIAGMPSKLLRTMFVANPASAPRILFKDTLSTWMTGGTNLKDMAAVLKITNDGLMARRGIAGGEVFQGLPADQANLLRRISSGKPGWETALAKLHVLHAKADAMARQARYDSYIKQGRSDLEATTMALESMNFTRRGMSSSLHILNMLNPFMNSQIQGIDTLVRSMKGTMPLNDKLQIRQKIIQRGMLVAASSMLYASLMQEDPDYQQATPDQKFNNWFVSIPGVDEKMRVPIPFEAGMLFKAVPEALVNYMYGNDRDAAEGMRQVVQRMIPGGDTYGIPLAIRPAIEAGLDKSFYTGRDLETAHEKTLEPGARSRASTSALADSVGETLNMSPIKIDHLISSYTGTLGLAVTHMASTMVFGKETPEVEGDLSQAPIVGTYFQPHDAGNVLNRAHEAMDEASKVKATYDDMLKKGRTDAAEAFLNKNAEEYNRASMEAPFKSKMTELAKYKAQIPYLPGMTAQQKGEELRRVQQLQTDVARQAINSFGESTPR